MTVCCSLTNHDLTLHFSHFQTIFPRIILESFLHNYELKCLKTCTFFFPSRGFPAKVKNVEKSLRCNSLDFKLLCSMLQRED